MLKWILSSVLFMIISSTSFALEISLSGAKENFKSYSTLHLNDDKPFLCQEMKDDFDVVKQVVCAFNKKPSSNIKKLQNSFFKIENKIKNKTFFLIITPFEKIKLYPMIFDMTKEKSIYQADVQLSNHWMLIGYTDELPHIKKEKTSDKAINFPFELIEDNLPYVGGLDLKGNPVHIKKAGDVTEYLNIKEYFEEKRFDKCLDLISEVTRDYPNSLFKAELIYYKIKVYAEVKDYDKVVELSKEYLREYSSDENVPEVLSIVANSYYKIGMNSDADYFFDRLFSEHENSVYAEWGYIYKANMLEAGGGASKALPFYEKALNETQDIDVAATAAFELAYFKTLYASKKEAAEYIMKIVNAKPEYFMKYLKRSMDMMYQFEEEEEYSAAAYIAKSIVKEMKKSNDLHEEFLKDAGVWLSKTNEKQKALDTLNEYISLYEEGLFETEVSIAKDELFFDTSDANFSVKLDEYNTLIDTYKDDYIGERAVYEKAKLLLDNNLYSDVLGIEDSLLGLDSELFKDIKKIIQDSAIGAMKLSLKNSECQNVLDLSSDYNITLSNEWDDGVYRCSMKGGDYQLANKVSERNLKSKDIEYRKKWLYRYIMVDFATGNYSDVIEASKDLIALIEDDKGSKYKDVYRTLFDTYQRLESKDKLLDAIVDIQNVFGRDYKDIERYIAVMSMGSEQKDDNIVIKYGEEVFEIQKRSKSYVQSPFVEFTLYQSYLNIEDLEKALQVVKSLDSVELKKLSRARQKYLLGTVLAKLWRDDEAQKAYQDAIDADPSSPWATLAKSAKDI